MKFVNKKRTRKGWTKIELPWQNAMQAEKWLRENREYKSGWYKHQSCFWFEKEQMATEITLRFG